MKRIFSLNNPYNTHIHYVPLLASNLSGILEFSTVFKIEQIFHIFPQLLFSTRRDAMFVSHRDLAPTLSNTDKEFLTLCIKIKFREKYAHENLLRKTSRTDPNDCTNFLRVDHNPFEE